MDLPENFMNLSIEQLVDLGKGEMELEQARQAQLEREQEQERQASREHVVKLVRDRLPASLHEHLTLEDPINADSLFNERVFLKLAAPGLAPVLVRASLGGTWRRVGDPLEEMIVRLPSAQDYHGRYTYTVMRWAADTNQDEDEPQVSWQRAHETCSLAEALYRAHEIGDTHEAAMAAARERWHAARVKQQTAPAQGCTSWPPDVQALDCLLAALNALRENKPEARSELARRYAVTITDLERVLGYFETFVVNRMYVEGNGRA